MWNAAQYLKFEDQRSRPFIDLLSQVGDATFRNILDLGCGTGHLTRTLAERWPDATVVGIDSSAAMLAKAQQFAIPDRLMFIEHDIITWPAQGAVDLIVSNAALQWVSNHEQMFPRLIQMLAPGGTLAVQMPNRFRTPSQTAIEETVNDPRWAAELKGIGLHQESVQPLSWYIQQLNDRGFRINAWDTTYYHLLTGENPVLDWLKGTALRPLLDRLMPDHQQQFLRSVGDRLQRAYPSRNGVTIFPMPRMFIVATY